MLDISALGAISDTALTSSKAIEMGAKNLPNTFVPGRNLIFLTFAAALAYRRGLTRIVAGMCETDFSGYPDCRDDAIKAMQVALNIGMESRFVIETPLMWIDKAAKLGAGGGIGRRLRWSRRSSSTATPAIWANARASRLGLRLQRMSGLPPARAGIRSLVQGWVQDFVKDLAGVR